jgi:hypothetical protein
MTSEPLDRWHRHRSTIVWSQIAPTFLLITTVALLQFGLADTALVVRVGTAGILLASGIFGALVQYQSATEAEAVAKELFAENASVAASARWLWVVKFVTPGIFIVIYAAFMVALFG